MLRADAVKSRRQTRFEAADVLLAVEVVSPDSEARDRDTKPHKYAAAGIPHFWLVEMAGETDHPAVQVYERGQATGHLLADRHPPRARQAHRALRHRHRSDRHRRVLSPAPAPTSTVAPGAGAGRRGPCGRCRRR